MLRVNTYFHPLFLTIFIFVIILVPLVHPTNVQVNSDSVTGTSATITWTHVDTSPSSILGFFRGYRVRSHMCGYYVSVSCNCDSDQCLWWSSGYDAHPDSERPGFDLLLRHIIFFRIVSLIQPTIT